MRRSLLEVALALALCSYLQSAIAYDSPQSATEAIDSITAKQNARAMSCCDQLRRIGFNSTLPVVIVDLLGSTLQKYVGTPAVMCTCG